MLQSMGLQRVGHNWVTEQQQRGYQTSLIITFFFNVHCTMVKLIPYYYSLLTVAKLSTFQFSY